MNKGNFANLGFGFGSMPNYKPIAAILTLPLNSQKLSSSGYKRIIFNRFGTEYFTPMTSPPKTKPKKPSEPKAMKISQDQETRRIRSDAKAAFVFGPKHQQP